MMDRLDAMQALVMTVDRGSLAAAARALGRSPAAVTRAIASLEARVGERLLHRTTRVVKATDAGDRYLAVCRRVLAELAEAELVASGERAAPRGTLTVTAPVSFGRLHVRPALDAFVAAHDELRARLLLLDRVVHLVDEGIDLAVRIGRLEDSSLVATRVGEVRRVTCASPAYLAAHRGLRSPADLAAHDGVSFSPAAGGDAWAYELDGRARRVAVRPRLSVNTAESAIASAVEGRGVTQVLSYQVERELRDGALVRLLVPFEPAPLPVHVVHAGGPFVPARTRAFRDALVPALREALARIAALPATRRARAPARRSRASGG